MQYNVVMIYFSLITNIEHQTKRDVQLLLLKSHFQLRFFIRGQGGISTSPERATNASTLSIALTPVYKGTRRDATSSVGCL